MWRWPATHWVWARPNLVADLVADFVPDLVTVGGLTVDNVIASDGTVGLAKAGGNGAYSAVGALLWCQRVGLVSHAVQSYPHEVIARLEAHGVDLGGVRWSDECLSACNWLIYDAAGERGQEWQSRPEELAEAGLPTDRLTAAELAVWRNRLAARYVPGEITYSHFRDLHPLVAEQLPDRYLKARGVHLAPSQPGVMTAMIDAFKPQGAIVIADPGWQLAACRLGEIEPILARLDAFLPSESELRALVPGVDLARSLAVIADICPGAVAVKLGAKGVMVWDRAQRHPVTIRAASVQALDPTGAGDSFCGGFLAGLIETLDPLYAAQFGAVSAGQIVQAFGADGALPLDRTGARQSIAGLLAQIVRAGHTDEPGRL